MPRGQRIPVQEIEEIVGRFNALRRKGKSLTEAYKSVAETMGRDWKVIASVMYRLQPTTDFAKVYLKAEALKLARRVVRNANVGEALDVLTRPNIGVLQPIKSRASGGAQVFCSITLDSIGAIARPASQVAAPSDQLSSNAVETAHDMIRQN
jgi:hypothetical protein